MRHFGLLASAAKTQRLFQPIVDEVKQLEVNLCSERSRHCEGRWTVRIEWATHHSLPVQIGRVRAEGNGLAPCRSHGETPVQQNRLGPYCRSPPLPVHLGMLNAAAA